MRAPEWMKSWRQALLDDAPEVAISLEGFRAGHEKPRSVKGASPRTVEEISGSLPSLTARVGRRVEGPGIDAGFRFDLYRGDSHVRSYAVAWRRDPGTFMVLRCARNATSIDDGANWTVEIKLGDAEYRGKRALVYQALYSHLNEGGRALGAGEVGRVRNVVRALDRLGLDLEPAETDPRRRPRLVTPKADAVQWFTEVVKTTIARVFLAGLLGSTRWATEARPLLGWSADTFNAFAYAYRWRGLAAVREAALERDLCARFERWALGSPGVQVVAEDKDGMLYRLVDGQRPDITVTEGRGVAVIEAKLGLTRDSVRTGLAQAREYAFHVARAGRPWPVLLLLGEPPEYHGDKFTDFVHDTASRLHVGVLVESGATEFIPWHPLPQRGLDVEPDGLIAWLCG